MSTAPTRVKNWSRAQWKADKKWHGDPFQWAPEIPNGEQPPVKNEFSQSLFPDGSKGYDRGHICASEDRIYSKEANEQTFYMANMQPQVHSFNAGIWKQMEDCLRSHLQSSDTLYICKAIRSATSSCPNIFSWPYCSKTHRATMLSASSLSTATSR